MSIEASRPSRAEIDPETRLEILGYRDVIMGQKVTIANLEWRLMEAHGKVVRLTKERDAMRASATWRIGRLVMLVLWPVRKVRSLWRAPEAPKPA